IKILQILYGFYQDEDLDTTKAKKALDHSIDKMYQLYLLLISMIAEMQGLAIDKIEAGRKKQLPTEEDLHPNTKFVRNATLRVLANSKQLQNRLSETGVGWGKHRELLRNLHRSLIEDEEYTTYMSSDERSFRHDREALLRMFRKHLINETAFQEMLEEESIFWVDDLDLASSMVIKTIKNIKEEDEEVDIMPVWRNDDDDKAFMVGLFTQTLAQGVLNEALIKEGAQNWELERIALIDRILMKMALAEAKTFESIPLKVTLNEYIELSKYYSTEKSHGFINGILDQLFTSLQESGDIKKTGRGLI
ncbi:MAG: transcription antitermination protein NusB, partial [Flavobacteriales bacterium]|nr:transcription antitermination protein NusB [Flavobacteriales bacterium]